MATQLFYWNLENGAQTDYFDFDVSGTTISTANAYPDGGTHSLLFQPGGNGTVVRAPASFSGVGPNFVSWPSTVSEIYLRWKMFVPGTIAGSGSGNHGWRLYNKNSASFNEIDTVAGTKSAGVGVGFGLVLFDFDASPNIDSGGTYQDIWQYPFDAWFEFAFRAKLNTMTGSTANSDGIATVWINGVQTYNATNVKYRGNNAGSITYTGWDTLYATSNYDTPGGGGTSYWYMDNIEVWDGIPSGDTTSPVCTITTPTSIPTYATSNPAPTVAGTASDDTAVTSVTWSNDRGGSGTATGTTSWSFTPTLQLGVNVLTVTAHDAASNTGTDTLTITYAPAAAMTPRMMLTLP